MGRVDRRVVRRQVGVVMLSPFKQGEGFKGASLSFRRGFRQ